MSKREGYKRHERQQQGADGDFGPSWYECAGLLQELERDYGCRIHFLVDPANASARWQDPAIHVRVRAYHFQDDEGAQVWASAPFRGNAGARTMAAAWYHALIDLTEVLETRQTPIERAIARAEAAQE